MNLGGESSSETDACQEQQVSCSSSGCAWQPAVGRLTALLASCEWQFRGFQAFGRSASLGCLHPGAGSRQWAALGPRGQVQHGAVGWVRVLESTSAPGKHPHPAVLCHGSSDRWCRTEVIGLNAAFQPEKHAKTCRTPGCCGELQVVRVQLSHV